MSAKVKEYSTGDLVENVSYIRKPRLRGIIVLCMGYDKELNYFIYKIYCYNTEKYEFWAHHSIKKI